LRLENDLQMQKFRTYGLAPFPIILVHGGPGAPGSLYPLAKELANSFSLVEAFQSQKSIDGQVEELKNILIESCQTPVCVLGHSWGAWLSSLLASRYPELVDKLILISAASFEQKYFNDLLQNRLRKILSNESPELQKEWKKLTTKTRFNDDEFQRLGKLMTKADTYQPISQNSYVSNYQSEVFHSIWKEAEELRASGQLMEEVSKIKCRLCVIHGTFDSHPWQGVKHPLEKYFPKLDFHLLDKCGHEPWNEFFAREKFLHILKKSLEL
jgi:pimeloyl-ACP methyl ester carboxylesterase